MARSPRAAARLRPLRRWGTAALAVTLFTLSLAAVLGSWRQAAIVRSVAADSTATDAYQEAAYRASTEVGLLQASLIEPDGAERRSVSDAERRTAAAIAGLAANDTEQARRNGEMAGVQQRLGPAVARYLTLLDTGDKAAAGELLETEIEPAADELLTGLRSAEQRQLQRYSAGLAQAEHDSQLLQLGTLLIFLVGLLVLAVIGWSSRSNRLAVERLAAHDALTGLPNRTAFQARTEAALAAARSGAGSATVLMLDLDGFKEVNDNLGHHAGDLLLVDVARRLQGSVRGHDTVARLGGDEFAILLTDGDPAAGDAAATRIGIVFDKPFVIDGITLDIEVSIGIASSGPDDDPDSLLRHADVAMYTAKEHRLGHARFDKNQEHATISRLTLLGDLRRALDGNDEMELHYQPKISVRTGELIGAEGLARWQHPTRGLVGPDEFIPVLEGTSLIHRFTVRVLDLALAQVRRWLDDGHRVPVAINVSTRSLLDTTFPDTVADALRRAAVPGDLLAIEITENTIMADPVRAIDVLRRIRELGVSTAIDDFGTGYSSMAYLKILPVDEIKVDRSFVREMATDHSDYTLVGSTVDLGHNLGLKVVAEGVEDAATMAALDGLGCDVVQGYHFARPLPAEDFAGFLTGRYAHHGR
jgi:diguanylate cyclase (GGDEF)-like protein